MTNMHNSLRKCAEKLNKLITELQTVEKEIGIILNSAENTKNNQLEDTVLSLDKMVNDEDLWRRRVIEHKKIAEHETPSKIAEHETPSKIAEHETPSKINVTTSNRPNNIDSEEVEPTPNPNLIKDAEQKAPVINALTRLSPDDRMQVLYGLYQQATKTVKSIVESYDEKKHAELVSRETDKLLEIWLKNN